MKKIKIFSMILAIMFIISISGHINAANKCFDCSVRYGEVKDGKVKTTITFTSDLKDDFDTTGMGKERMDKN